MVGKGRQGSGGHEVRRADGRVAPRALPGQGASSEGPGAAS